jgi:uncharacterized protein (DUF2336 family)
MSAAYSLLPGLDDVVNSASPQRRASALRQIADLFVQGAAHFRSDHIELFDGILSSLAPLADSEVRGELAERMATLANAPPALVRQLVEDVEIGIAGPLLRGAPPIGDDILIAIARLRGQGHLMAISERPQLSPPLTDVIVRRGEREVIRKVAGNRGARFSPLGYSGLIRRAEQDGVLALTVGQRGDLTAPLLKDLLAVSVDAVRRQLFESADPASKVSINWALGELSAASSRPATTRDFAPAQRAIVQLHHSGVLNESTLLGFAKAHQYEQAIAALSAMSGVRIATLDQLVMGERHDPILILGKSIGLQWVTVRALITLRLGPGRAASAPDIEDARLNFQRLAQPTAQRVLNFWRTREPPKG